MEEVENTIRRQKDKLSVSSPRYAPFPPELDQLLIYTPDQGMLPFRKLDKHLPETLWAKFKQRELKHSDYLESCSQLLKEIEDESEKRTGLRTDRSTAQHNDSRLTPLFSRLIYEDICEWASGSLLGILGNDPDYKFGSGPNGERWL